MKHRSEMWKIARDVCIFVLGVLAAFALVHWHFVEALATIPAGVPVAALLAGVLFSSVFTAAPGAIAIAQLIAIAGPWEVILVGSVGSVVGNLVMYKFARGSVSKELNHLLAKWGHREWLQIVRDHHFRWLAIVIASALIISPLPDDFGVVFLGISRVPVPVFAVVCYVTNAVCMLALTFVGRFV